MTSIRKFLELVGTLDKIRIDYFLKNEGSVPLCCYICKQECKGGKIKVKCDMLEEFLGFRDFKKFCLKCQKSIRKWIDART